MKVSFVITGEEIISGFKQDKNFSYAARILYSAGFSIYAQFVGDRKDEIIFALKNAEKFSDIIICSGGLGSTSDDLTRFVASEYFGLELEENQKAIESIREKFFERTGRKDIPDILKIQALIPKGAEPLISEKGSAPGFKIEKNGKKFFFLPGVPTEFQEMFSKYVIPHLGFQEKKEIKIFKIFGLTETQIEKVINEIRVPPSVRVSYFPSFPEVVVRISGDRAEAEKFSKNVREKLKDFIYSEKEEESFKDVIGELLKKKKLTVSTAESLTGGELANMLTDIPGSSLYFKGGEIVYSNEAKMKLGVKKETIERFGAVSHECAKELAESVRKKFGTHIGISTTGVAGPDPLEGKNPGLFFIGISTENSTESYEFMFNIGRKYIKILCSYLALKLLKDKIDDKS